MYSRFKWHPIISWGSVGAFEHHTVFSTIPSFRHYLSLFLSLPHSRSMSLILSIVWSDCQTRQKHSRAHILHFVCKMITNICRHAYTNLQTVSMRLQSNNNINNIVFVCLFAVTAVATVSVHLFLFIANTTEWCLSVWFDMLRLQMPFQWMHLIRFWFSQTIR